MYVRALNFSFLPSIIGLITPNKATNPINPISTYQFSTLITIHFFKIWGNWIKDQSIFSLVIILLILMTFLLPLNQYWKNGSAKERCHAICVLFLKPKTCSHQNNRKPSIRAPGGLFIWSPFEAGFNRNGGGLCNLETTMASVLHKELECKVEKLKYKTFKVGQARIRIKSELPVGN